MKQVLAILFFILAFIFAVDAQPLSKSSLPRFYTSLPSPNVCNVNLRSQAVIYVKNSGLYKCIGNVYVSAESVAASGVTSLNGRTGALSLILGDIPSLPAAQITSGTFGLTLIPDLPASRITSGTFGAARIPSLPTSQITSGTFDLARLPSIPASQTTSGVFSPDRLGTGTRNGSNFLRDDGVWTAVVGGGGAYTLNSASYANLGVAITSIGATATHLTITTNFNCNSAVVVPQTLKLEAINGAQIVKQSGCTINFSGFGLVNPKSEVPIFSGFSAGNITWSGSVYPREISTYLFSTTDLTAALQVLTGAFSSKDVDFIAYPSTITGLTIIKERQGIIFQKGTFLNTANEEHCFILESNTFVRGQGNSTVIRESSTINPAIEYRNIRLFYASGFSNHPPYSILDGTNRNIQVSHFKVESETPAQGINSGASTIALGNCIDCDMSYLTFEDVHGFATYCGGFGTAGFYADNCDIHHNTYRGLNTQNAGFLNAINSDIYSNTFIINSVDPLQPLQATIDLEPNALDDRMENIKIYDNTFDGRAAIQSWNAILAQPGSNAKAMLNISITDNLIMGVADSPTSAATGYYLGNAISVAGINHGIISGNITKGSTQNALVAYESKSLLIQNNNFAFQGGGGNEAIKLWNVFNSEVSYNRITLSNNAQSQSNDISETNITGIAGATGSVNTSGTSVTKVGGGWFYFWYIGQPMIINGVTYTATAMSSDGFTLTVTPAPGTQSAVSFTPRLSGNLFKDNVMGSVYLATASTSKIISPNSLLSSPSACSGSTTLASGVSPTITTSCATTTSRIVLTPTNFNNNGTLRITKAAGSFVINSSNGADASNIDWVIFN